MSVKVYLLAGLGNQLFIIFAVLSYSIDKTPKQWFGSANSSLDTQDMCPDNWNVIDI